MEEQYTAPEQNNDPQMPEPTKKEILDTWMIILLKNIVASSVNSDQYKKMPDPSINVTLPGSYISQQFASAAVETESVTLVEIKEYLKGFNIDNQTDIVVSISVGIKPVDKSQSEKPAEA